VTRLQLLGDLGLVAGQNLGDDAVDAELARDRIGGTLLLPVRGTTSMLL
jgi:hypothetical protein